MQNIPKTKKQKKNKKQKKKIIKKKYFSYTDRASATKASKTTWRYELDDGPDGSIDKRSFIRVAYPPQ
jgi:hypothetical protein